MSYSPLSSLSFTPRFVWHAYVKYLWSPHPTAWVTKVAYSFRVLAFLLILPVLILTLVDITSYVIVRTLGIVDDEKPSTSGQPVVTAEDTPSILVEDVSSEESPPAELACRASPAHRGHNTEMRNASVQEEMKPQAFFAGEEDLQLSSVGLLSPTPSQPSSPVLLDDKLSREVGAMEFQHTRNILDEETILRRRAQGT